MKDLWVPLSGAISQQRKIDTLANNIANANTPGFKKDHLSFKEHLTVLEKGHQDIDLPNKEFKPEVGDVSNRISHNLQHAEF